MDRRAVLITFALLACSPTSQIVGDPRVFQARNAKELAVRVAALPAGTTKWKLVEPKETLHTGDQFAVLIRTGQPLYLYAFRVAPGGTLSSLNEAGTDARSAALDLPVNGQAYTLDASIGVEDLRVVASTAALDPQRAAAAVGGGDQGPARRDPPPILTEGRRDPYTIRDRLDAAGLAVVRFQFTHQ